MKSEDQKPQAHNDSSFPRGWDEHKKDQIRHIAKNSTPMQRFQWLLDVLQILRIGSKQR